jgi:hypothetical protein
MPRKRRIKLASQPSGTDHISTSFGSIVSLMFHPVPLTASPAQAAHLAPLGIT